MNDNIRIAGTAECPECNGLGGGYVRTGAADQWEFETCEWCFGTGDVPALVADLLEAVAVVPAHCVSDRGFIQFDYIDLGEDRRVRVYESSVASEAKVWLRLVDGEGMACAQLTLRQARLLADQLVWLTKHHHMAAVDGETSA